MLGDDLPGDTARNSDGEVHAAITCNDDCSWTLGLEDLDGGGDRDYSYLIMRVEGALVEKP